MRARSLHDGLGSDREGRAIMLLRGFGERLCGSQGVGSQIALDIRQERTGICGLRAVGQFDAGSRPLCQRRVAL